MKKLVLVIGLVTGIFVLANAQTNGASQQRQENQHQRIQEGIESGELNRAEVRRLKTEQRHIEHKKNIAAADGVVTGRERRHIKRDQRKASRDIYRQKNDTQLRK